MSKIRPKVLAYCPYCERHINKHWVKYHAVTSYHNKRVVDDCNIEMDKIKQFMDILNKKKEMYKQKDKKTKKRHKYDDEKNNTVDYFTVDLS